MNRMACQLSNWVSLGVKLGKTPFCSKMAPEKLTAIDLDDKAVEAAIQKATDKDKKAT